MTFNYEDLYLICAIISAFKLYPLLRLSPQVDSGDELP